MKVELIPSAKRLIRSLRDIGYEFSDAVADIIDNSIEAQATVINIIFRFEGEDSYLIIADNGVGMTAKGIQEGLRFGSNRSYEDVNDLGRYGLGLKTASLSQCERLTVSARRGEERALINSFCWDLDHIEKTNRWEILKINADKIKEEALHHLQDTTGTVVTWERLGRLLGYKYPSGEHARKQVAQMADGLKLHLGMVFHRFLSGEIRGKRIAIYINEQKVMPWDPFSRGEKNTQKLDQIIIPLSFEDDLHNVIVQPYILPPQSLFSSPKAHLSASGPEKWNKQQGFYIYRSNRLIQTGGWSGLRTSDEHTKLVRMAVFIPSQLDELFQVNVAKKHLKLPRDLRSTLIKEIQPIIQRAQEVYRDKVVDGIALTGPNNSQSRQIEPQQSSTGTPPNYLPATTQKDLSNADYYELFEKLVTQVIYKVGFEAEINKIDAVMESLFKIADLNEKKSLVSLLTKFTENNLSK
jgi:hypothetical protein